MPMKKIGRNDACPCGSGNKYKRCHGAIDSSLHSSFVEQPEHVLYAPTPNMLMNRVDREAQIIANGFDDLCRDHVAEIEEIYGSISVLLLAGSKKRRASPRSYSTGSLHSAHERAEIIHCRILADPNWLAIAAVSMHP
jgi:hypothetical protein